ncbi:exported protein of unknown function [Bradyrhizobium sp. ORS 285]|nr:exported hypothetical protein [Bradyrhizobium sp. ORS 285]SMX61511.1 exported protein of unknown function [Bradyrhizobium sp. ORS 285]
MNLSQTLSIVGAVLAVLTAGVGYITGQLGPAEAFGLLTGGLSILGVHTGGSVAGAMRDNGIMQQ